MGVVYCGALQLLLLVSCGLSASGPGWAPARSATGLLWPFGFGNWTSPPQGTGGGSASPPSADEAMLDWLVSSVRLGWTPREVMIWFFPDFGDLLFDMISDVSEEA